MQVTIPTMLTLVRILMLPILVAAVYLPWAGANQLAVAVFVLAAITDWADGWIARRFEMTSRLGAFLDPVADKLMVAVALVLIIQANPSVLIALSGAIIIGREITVSALREWMAELGEGARVRVRGIGKLKTVAQMVAIGFCLYRDPLFDIPILTIGHGLLVVAAVLTLISMSVYLRAAWPVLKGRENSN